MKLVAPSFWQRRGLIAQMLRPFSWIYSGVSCMLRWFKRPKKVSAPVICVGNLTMGGSGKTPVVIALREWFDIHGWEHIAFLTRGYQGKEKGPLMVDLDHHTAADVGDEALILAQYEPTWVARNRFQGAEQAVNHGANILLMDDGLQHYSLQQDIRLVVVDGHYGFGNELVFPAGPLRESLNKGLKRADAIILVGEDRHGLKERFEKIKPVFRMKIVPFMGDDEERLDDWKDHKIFAFAGIGHPEKFHDFLIKNQCQMVEFKSFPDHHPYKQRELDKLWQQAQALGATLVTTQKDFVRLPQAFQDKVKVCYISAEFIEPRNLDQFLKDKLAYVN